MVENIELVIIKIWQLLQQLNNKNDKNNFIINLEAVYIIYTSFLIRTSLMGSEASAQSNTTLTHPFCTAIRQFMQWQLSFWVQ